ncbi:MAG TPA: hypothetical protein DDZ89_09780 [Clostridiales bacterium]|nr:hypothetical protein [Clostridiales bacterium]
MYFFDCNVSYGVIGDKNPFMPVDDVEQVLKDMDKAGIHKAVVYRKEQLHGADIATGNCMVSLDVKDNPRLYGCWSLVPSDTEEIQGPDQLLKSMKQDHIIGWRISPSYHRFSKKPYVLEDYFEKACRCNVPVFISTAGGYSLDDLADILDCFPKLTVILTYDNIWPNDRYLRPLVRKYENVYLDLSQVITAGGLEDFIQWKGSHRLLFGSGYSDSYFGAGMLQVLKANISEKDKENIAYINMERIIGGIRYD